MSPFELFMWISLAAIAGLIALVPVIMILRGRRVISPDPRVYAVQVFTRTSEENPEPGPTTSHVSGRWRRVFRMASRISMWPDVERVNVLTYHRSEDRMVLWSWERGRRRNGASS